MTLIVGGLPGLPDQLFQALPQFSTKGNQMSDLCILLYDAGSGTTLTTLQLVSSSEQPSVRDLSPATLYSRLAIW